MWTCCVLRFWHKCCAPNMEIWQQWSYYTAMMFGPVAGVTETLQLSGRRRKKADASMQMARARLQAGFPKSAAAEIHKVLRFQPLSGMHASSARRLLSFKSCSGRVASIDVKAFADSPKVCHDKSIEEEQPAPFPVATFGETLYSYLNETALILVFIN